MKRLGVMLDSELHFLCHVNNILSQEVRTLGLTYYLPSSNNLVLYTDLVRPVSKLEYNSVVWYNVTYTHSNKSESGVY
jgi:hypothetical protein